MAVFGLIVGVGFKISAVPFHFWCPDVFEGASIDVSAFLSVASKGAALALLLRVLMVIASAAGFHSAPGISLTAIAIVIGIIGSVTATVGNLAAFVQTNIKRLLAYSSIAHAGYMLCALSLLVQLNDQARCTARLGIGAAGDFALSGGLSVHEPRRVHRRRADLRVPTGSEEIDEYAGLGTPLPRFGGCVWALFMFSLVGLPPFAGFVAKLNVMYVLGTTAAGGGRWSR